MIMTKIKLFIILSLSLLISCTNQIIIEEPINKFNEKPIKEGLIVGYCPTMEPYANMLKDNYDFEVKELGSALIVLNNLNDNQIDVALIGRKAYLNEKINLHEKQLKEGYTLIFKERMIFDKNNLNQINIFTSEKNLSEIYYDLNLIYDENFNFENVNLINWQNFNDYELFIVMDGLNKDLRFRTPFIYSKDEDLIKNIEIKKNEIINGLIDIEEYTLKEFNDCLADNGMVIYGLVTCPHCTTLVNKLGGYDKVENLYIECTKERQICNDEEIKSVPSIKINGEIYQGQRTLENFSQLTGCSLPI
jgi:hypothetical protein